MKIKMKWKWKWKNIQWQTKLLNAEFWKDKLIQNNIWVQETETNSYTIKLKSELKCVGLKSD